jgi:hypothetical protein
MPDFQIALAKLIGSPQLCETVLRDETVFFAEFDLTEKEKKRLNSVLRQKGISACCSLYRMNRITPVYTQLINTSTLLGDGLVPLVEEFWLQYPEPTLQFRDEVLEFGRFLMNKIETGIVHIPYLKQVLQVEIAINELSYLPEGEIRMLKFGLDIFKILQCVNTGTLQEETIEKDDNLYKMYLEDQKLQMEIV